MKQNVWIGGVAAITIALGCGAAAQTSAPSTQREQANSASSISVIGCLQGSNAAVGTTGTGTPSSTGSAAGGASAAADRFMLMNAMTSTGAATPGAATPGAAPTPAPGAAPTGSASRTATPSASGGSYIIEGNAAELRPHVNQQVQITGRIESGATSSTGSAGSTGSTTGATTPSGSASTPSAGSTSATGSQTAASAANAPRLRVESVKMVAATCTPK